MSTLAEFAKKILGPESLSKEPDTEQNVLSQTIGVFSSYVHERWRIEERDGTAVNSPDAQTQNRAIVEVARQLAKLGDDFDAMLKAKFEEITKPYGNSLNSYDTFQRIASEIFRDGINWGKIFIILSYGYWLIKPAILEKNHETIEKVVATIASFIVCYFAEAAVSVGKWIAARGGWSVAIHVTPGSFYSSVVPLGIIVAAAATIAVVVWLKRRATP